MPKTTPRLSPRIDVLETRLALSTPTGAGSVVAGPTPAEYHAAVRRIGAAVALQAAGGSEAHVDAALGRAVQGLPGGDEVLPALVAEVASTSLTTRGSALAERRRLLDILDAYFQPDAPISTSGQTSTSRPNGSTPSGSTVTNPVASFPRNFTVTIRNASNAQVTVNLTQASTPIPLVSSTIAGNDTARFLPVTVDNQSLPITLSVAGYSGTANVTNAFSRLVVSFRNGQPYYQTYL